MGSDIGSNGARRVMVTGHLGYLGSVMVPILLSGGYEVVGLDTCYYDGCDLGDLPLEVPMIRKDIRDIAFKDLEGFDAVVHLAALCNDPIGDLNPELTLDINHRASVKLARLAKDAGVRRFLFASSCSMYGAAGDDLLTEQAPLKPITAYAESKARTEQDVSKLADRSFSPTFMRNATAYGASPRLRADVVLNNLTCWAFTTGKIRILSDGTPWRPIVHVEDIALAVAAVLAAPRGSVHNQAFNVGSNGDNYQVRELAETVREVMPSCEIEYAGKASPDPRNYRVDFSKISKLVPSFKPNWNARLGVQQLRDAFRRFGMKSEDFQGRRFTRLLQLRFLLGSGRLEPSLRWRADHPN